MENGNVSVTENVVVNKVENKNPSVPKNKNTKNIIAISAIIVLFLILLFVTFSYFNSPKRRMVGIINKVYSKLADNESSKKISKILNNNIVGFEGETTFSLSGDIDGETSGPLSDTAELMLNSLGNTVIKYNYVEDKKNKKSSFELDSSINNEKLIEMYGLIKDDKLYFNLKNLIDKYFYTEFEFVELKSIIDNSEDAKYILDILKDTIIESLDSDDFSKSKATIKINGKSKKVQKMTFNFSDKYIVDIMASFMKKIKNDEKALNILLSTSEELTKDEFLEEIDYLIENAKEVKATQDFTFNMYVKDYLTTVKYELVANTTKIAYYDYKDTKKFTMSEDNVKYLDIKIENNKDISGTIAMMIPFTGTYEDETLNLNTNLMGIECDLTISLKDKTTNNSVEIDSLFKLKVVQSNEEYLNLSIDSKNSISKFDKINELDVSNSTHVDEISESDQETIINNILKLPVIGELISQAKSTIEQSLLIPNNMEISMDEDYVTY